jgi:hypothetical protein
MAFAYNLNLIIDNKPTNIKVEFPCCGWYLSINGLPDSVEEESDLADLVLELKDNERMEMDRQGDGSYLISKEILEKLEIVKSLCEKIQSLPQEEPPFMGKTDDELLEVIYKKTGHNDIVGEHILVTLKQLKEDGFEVKESLIDSLEVKEDCNVSFITIGGRQYIVADDSRAEAYARKYLEEGADELMGIDDLPEIMKEYIDIDRWVNDCISCDGLGHTLNKYDGREDCQSVNGDYYNLYRQN